MDTASLVIVRRPLGAPPDGWRLVHDPGGPYGGKYYEGVVACSRCGARRIIRRHSAENLPRLCRKCGALATGRSGPKPWLRRGRNLSCLACGKVVWRAPSNEANKTFCAKSCANEYRRKYPKLKRECRTCGASFIWNQKPFSNSTGNYCSRKCRDAGFLNHVCGDQDRPT